MTTDYAIINTGGKQYRVREGDTVDVERLDGEVGAEITFDRVLMTSVGGKLSVGAPAVEGASVNGEIAGQTKADKVISLRYKNKTRQRVKRGHRQFVTSVTIKSISAKYFILAPLQQNGTSKWHIKKVAVLPATVVTVQASAWASRHLAVKRLPQARLSFGSEEPSSTRARTLVSGATTLFILLLMGRSGSTTTRKTKSA